MKSINIIMLAVILAHACNTFAQTANSTQPATRAEREPLFQKLYLGQHDPNPASVHQPIAIPFRSTVGDDAAIIVTNDEGEPVITFGDLKGKESVTIDAGRLPAGSYQYHLVVWGRIVKRRKLLITEN